MLRDSRKLPFRVVVPMSSSTCAAWDSCFSTAVPTQCICKVLICVCFYFCQTNWWKVEHIFSPIYISFLGVKLGIFFGMFLWTLSIFLWGFLKNYFYKSSLHNMEISLVLGIKKLSEMNLSFLSKDFLASCLNIEKFQYILLSFLYIITPPEVIL